MKSVKESRTIETIAGALVSPPRPMTDGAMESAQTMYDDHTRSVETDALNGVTSAGCEDLLRLVTELGQSDGSWRRWEHASTYLLGRVRWLESLAAQADPLADAVRTDLVELMETPVGEIFDRMFGGPMDAVTLATVREGLRREFPTLRAIVRAELSRSGAPISTDTVTAEQAARICHNTPKTIRRWVRSGRLQPLSGPPYRFLRSDVEAARDRRPNDDNLVDLDRRADEILQRGRR